MFIVFVVFVVVLTFGIAVATSELVVESLINILLPLLGLDAMADSRWPHC